MKVFFYKYDGMNFFISIEADRQINIILETTGTKVK